jgi:hypothetical protein
VEADPYPATYSFCAISKSEQVVVLLDKLFCIIDKKNPIQGQALKRVLQKSVIPLLLETG